MTASNISKSCPARILSLESSASACSVALHAGPELLGASRLLIPRSASAQLAPMINALLSQCGCAPSYLHAVAVSSGPGSYTGLRVSVSLAKGLCYALRIPLISVDTPTVMTLQALEAAQSTDAMLLCAAIDAGVNVFCTMMDRSGVVLASTQPYLLAADSFSSWLEQGKTLFFGSGAAKISEAIQSPYAVFMSGVIPLAEYVGQAAAAKFQAKEFDDYYQFEPLYFREYMPTKSSDPLR